VEFDIPSSGEIKVDGVPLQRLKSEQLARFRAEKIGFIFQTFNLIPTLSALKTWNTLWCLRINR
jgi:putative ABC transport system ATP-binding protein